MVTRVSARVSWWGRINCGTSASDVDVEWTVVVFVRGDTFDVTGNCYVAMDKPEDAQRLIEYGHLRMVGGNVVRMSHVSVSWPFHQFIR